jgi:hypothetical protein
MLEGFGGASLLPAPKLQEILQRRVGPAAAYPPEAQDNKS